MISKRAENYGSALFELKAEADLLKKLKTLSSVVSEKQILDFFNSFRIPLSDKKKIASEILKKEDSYLRNLFFILLDKKSISLLPEIVQVYENLLNEKQGVMTGEIVSAEAVSKEDKKEVALKVGEFLNKKIDLVEKQDQSLLGGLYVKVGNYIFNDTIKCHLKKFQSSGGK